MVEALHIDGVLRRVAPDRRPLPVVLDSPHSGKHYPDDHGAAVPASVMQGGEDVYVDELFGEAPRHGAVLLHALFARTYIDPNRDEADIDTSLLADEWTGPINATFKQELGKSLIWRLTANSRPIYDRKLPASEIKARIERYWRPYHDALDEALDSLHGHYGAVWHINCHSMHSIAGRNQVDYGQRRPDFTISDRLGKTCEPEFMTVVVDCLRGKGYDVRVNDPYQGAEIVRRYGRPHEARHSLQIEINRALYVVERSQRKHSGFEKLRADLGDLVAAVCDFARARVA